MDDDSVDFGALLGGQRAATTARLESLRGQFRAILDGSQWSTDDDEHDPEGSTIAFERAKVSSMIRDAEAELLDVAAAAARLEAGTFGVCERCGGTIATMRLEALPTATRCITCVRQR